MLARYVTVRRGLLGVVDDIVGFAPSSHGTTNPLAGPAGVFGCIACAQQRAGSAFMRKVNQPPPEAPGPAWYTTLTTRHDEVVTPYRSQALAGDHATNVILQDRCPADPFEHVTLVGDPVALQWAINALGRPGAADPGFKPDCTGFAVIASTPLRISLGTRTAKGIRVRCRGPRGAVCIGRLVSGRHRRRSASGRATARWCGSRPAACARCSRCPAAESRSSACAEPSRARGSGACTTT
jgi:hypothetical protein